MRAQQLQSYDGPGALALVDVPEPAAADGEALVDIHAIGINFPDLLATKGSTSTSPSCRSSRAARSQA